VLRDERTILQAREAAERLLADDPDLAGAPELRAAVEEMEQSRHSDYMEKS
jgi:ATP-dependent DNA helicase RecG